MTKDRPNDQLNARPGDRPSQPGPTSAVDPETAEIERLRAEIERLEGELAVARQQADEYLAGLQRERAEFLNFKRRTAEEREAMLGLAAEALLSKVLALADDFDRAIEARPADLADHPWVEGIVAIDRKLRALLESEGVRPIEAGPGTRFDPREHDAIMNVPSPDRAEGEIVEEIRRGYRLRDRVLRPALVAVAAGPEAVPAEEGTTSSGGHPGDPSREPSGGGNGSTAPPSPIGPTPTPTGEATAPERSESHQPEPHQPEE